MEPARLDITVRQGGTFTKKFKFQDPTVYPLAGCTVRSQIRDKTLRNILVDMSTDPLIGGITVDPVLGTIYMQITAAETALLEPQMAEWDLEIDKGGGVVDPFLWGNCYIGAEVTK